MTDSAGLQTHLHGYCPTAKKRVQVSYDGGELPTCPGCGQGDMEDLSIHPAHSSRGDVVMIQLTEEGQVRTYVDIPDPLQGIEYGPFMKRYETP